MSNNLPNPIPAGTVVFVPDGEPRKANRHDIVLGDDGQFYERTGWPNDKPRQVYTRHTLTAPLHHLTPEMVEAVRKAIYRLRLESSMWADVLEHAFAHVLTPPVVEENTKTVREQLEETGDVGPRWLIVADAIDAVIARLDKAGI